MCFAKRRPRLLVGSSLFCKLTSQSAMPSACDATQHKPPPEDGMRWCSCCWPMHCNPMVLAAMTCSMQFSGAIDPHLCRCSLPYERSSLSFIQPIFLMAFKGCVIVHCATAVLSCMLTQGMHSIQQACQVNCSVNIATPHRCLALLALVLA